MVILDATIVAVALPALGRDLGSGVAGLQWVVDAYTVVLAGLLLLGGSLGDRFGSRRVFLAALVAFTLASVGCGLAPPR
jgi:MFS family permease